MNVDQTGWSVLDAVDELTLPQKRNEQQDIIRDGHVIGQQRVQVTLPPLLTQLSDAIRSSIGGNSSGASLKSEGSPLDADALYKFIQIDTLIRDWCRGMNLTPGKNPADNLRAWYVETMKHPSNHDADNWHIKKMTSWVGSIRAKLDPWREKDLPDECPACGATSWWREGAEYYRPLVIRYKPTGPDLIQHARALCRACETVWAVRELAWALEQKEQATA